MQERRTQWVRIAWIVAMLGCASLSWFIWEAKVFRLGMVRVWPAVATAAFALSASYLDARVTGARRWVLVVSCFVGAVGGCLGPAVAYVLEGYAVAGLAGVANSMVRAWALPALGQGAFYGVFIAGASLVGLLLATRSGSSPRER